MFVRRTNSLGAESSSSSSLLSLNDRGANQSLDWINLRGHVYAAYRSSYYGVDQLYLLNPLEVTGAVPIVTVHYRYELSVPKIQKDEASGNSITLDNALHEALIQALGKVSKTEAKDIGEQKEPICPIPPSGKATATTTVMVLDTTPLKLSVICLSLLEGSATSEGWWIGLGITAPRMGWEPN